MILTVESNKVLQEDQSMASSACNFQDRVTRQLFYFFQSQNASRIAFVFLFSSQLSLTPTAHHQQLPGLSHKRSVCSSAANASDFSFKVGDFARQELVRFVPVTELPLISKSPCINLTFFSNNS